MNRIFGTSSGGGGSKKAPKPTLQDAIKGVSSTSFHIFHIHFIFILHILFYLAYYDLYDLSFFFLGNEVDLKNKDWPL